MPIARKYSLEELFQTINERSVYICTGDPLPSDIELMLQYLLNEDFSKCYDYILKIHTCNDA